MSFLVMTAWKTRAGSASRPRTPIHPASRPCRSERNDQEPPGRRAGSNSSAGRSRTQGPGMAGGRRRTSRGTSAGGASSKADRGTGRRASRSERRPRLYTWESQSVTGASSAGEQAPVNEQHKGEDPGDPPDLVRAPTVMAVHREIRNSRERIETQAERGKDHIGKPVDPGKLPRRLQRLVSWRYLIRCGGRPRGPAVVVAPR